MSNNDWLYNEMFHAGLAMMYIEGGDPLRVAGQEVKPQFEGRPTYYASSPETKPMFDALVTIKGVLEEQGHRGTSINLLTGALIASIRGALKNNTTIEEQLDSRIDALRENAEAALDDRAATYVAFVIADLERYKGKVPSGMSAEWYGKFTTYLDNIAQYTPFTPIDNYEEEWQECGESALTHPYHEYQHKRAFSVFKAVRDGVTTYLWTDGRVFYEERRQLNEDGDNVDHLGRKFFSLSRIHYTGPGSNIKIDSFPFDVSEANRKSNRKYDLGIALYVNDEGGVVEQYDIDPETGEITKVEPIDSQYAPYQGGDCDCDCTCNCGKCGQGEDA